LRLAELGQYAERIAWVQANFITQDTERLAASANEAMTSAQVEIATSAARFIGVNGLDKDTARKLDMLRSGITIPAPMDAAKTAEQAEIGAKLKSLYGTGKFCRAENDCLALGQLEEIIEQSRDPATLLEAWDGWHRVAVPMKGLYARQVELANEGARELGFDNLGTMWRSGYDMDPDSFALELDRIWGQLKPLYDALHCRQGTLDEVYGTDLVQVNHSGASSRQHVGAELENLYDIVGPEMPTSITT
jgi:peptidyl-dipeptidase A